MPKVFALTDSVTEHYYHHVFQNVCMAKLIYTCIVCLNCNSLAFAVFNNIF